MIEETKKTKLFSFLDREISRLDKVRIRVNSAREQFETGNYVVTNDLLAGDDATTLGNIEAQTIYETGSKELYSLYKMIINDDPNIEAAVNTCITDYEEKMRRYVIAQNVIVEIDTKKREIAKSLPKVNNNVDVISQRDWFTVSYIKHIINSYSEMIDIFTDLRKLLIE